MFENMNEQQARDQILKMVEEYCSRYHNNKKAFNEGDRIPYASRVYDSREMVNLVDSSLEFWLTAGRYTDEFEKKLSEYLGVKYCALVNSLKRKPHCIYGSHLAPAGRTGDKARKRGNYCSSGISYHGNSNHSVWGCSCFC